MAVTRILRRQVTDGSDDGYYNGYWWYSPTAYAIKWAVIGTLLLIVVAYFLGGYLHARRRMKRGLPPLAYHKWLVPRRQRAAFVQQYPQYAAQMGFYRLPHQNPYGHGQAYRMGAYPPPPPAYQEPEYVPAYTPAAPNKVDPDQHYTAPVGGPSQPQPAIIR